MLWLVRLSLLALSILCIFCWTVLVHTWIKNSSIFLSLTELLESITLASISLICIQFILNQIICWAFCIYLELCNFPSKKHPPPLSLRRFWLCWRKYCWKIGLLGILFLLKIYKQLKDKCYFYLFTFKIKRNESCSWHLPYLCMRDAWPCKDKYYFSSH